MNTTETKTFEADVARLLQLMVHSVYSGRDIFLRELISNAADACEKLRFEAITHPELLGVDAKPRITIGADADKKRLSVEDNGIGMSHDEMAEALGTIARSGTRAYLELLLLTDPVDSFWVTISPTFEGKSFASVTQGAANLASIPLLGDADRPASEPGPEVAAFLRFVKSALADAVSDVKASDRLTESAVCLVAPEHGPDRQFERLLSAAGRLEKAARPVLEINPAHERIVAVAKLGEDELSFKRDVAQLLYDEARVLDGDRPIDAKAFSERLARLIARGLPKS